jgi:GT2 family glycosyltransferase
MQIGFSIVVPTYNRPAHVRRCVEAIAGVSYPAHLLELIVVDDGSTSSVAEGLAGVNVPFSWRVLRQKNSGPAAARNRGVGECCQPMVAFIDDDCRPDAQWLSRFAGAALENPGAALGGRTVNALQQNVYAETSQQLIDTLYEHQESTRSQAAFFTSNNLAFPVERLKTVGGFSEDFPLAAAEDREICYRWTRNGGRLVKVPDAVVYHEHALTLERFCRQHFNYGRGAYAFHRKAPEAYAERNIREAIRFYTGLLVAPIRRTSPAKGLVISGLTVLSQAANAAGFFYELRTARSKSRTVS